MRFRRRRQRLPLEKAHRVVEKPLSGSPGAQPTGISVVLGSTLAAVCDVLNISLQTREQSFSKVFAESGSSAMDRLGSKARPHFE